MRARWGTLVMLLLAACGFAVTVQALAWWHVGPTTIGPIESRSCFETPCKVINLSWTTGSAFWIRMGYAAYGGGLIATFVAVMCAAGIAAKRVPVLLGKMMLVAVLTAVVPATMFITQVPKLAQMSIGIGVPVFFASVMLGIAASISVFRASRPQRAAAA